MREGDTRWHPALQPPRTRFVQDRARELAWEERAYLYDLLRLEALLEPSEGSGSFGGGLERGTLTQRHPVEAQAIRLELREGRYIDSETWQRMQVEYAEAQAREAAARRAAAAAKEEQERVFWMRVTGKPAPEENSPAR